MDTEIRKDNKIPGCEQLTRPEEIAALSKYLGNIKKVQEEHTKLDEDSLEIPGRTTGRIPKIDELEDTIIPGEGNIKSLGLENTRLSIEGDIQKINLENKVEELKKPEQLGELPKIIDKLKNEEDIRLDTTLEKLKGSEEIPLETTLEKLENPKKDLNSLSDFIETITEKELEELDNKKEPLFVESNSKLSDFLQKLSDERNINLENRVSELNVDEDNNLDNTRLDLSTEDLNDLRQSIDELNTSDIDDLRPDLKKLNSNDVDDLRKSESRFLGDIIRAANSKLDENGLYDLTIKLLKADGSEWAERMASIISTYLGKTKIELNKAKEFEKILANSFVSSRREIDPLGQLPKDLTGFDNELKKDRINIEAPGKADDPNNENDNYAPESGLSKNRAKRPENYHQQIITDEEGVDHEEDDTFTTGEDEYKDSKREYIDKWFGVSRYIRNKADIRVPDLTQRLIREEDNEVLMSRSPQQVPAYNVNIGSFKDFGYKFLNGEGANSYLRYVAERTIGSKAALGSLRTQLLNETLALLVLGREKTERMSETDRGRLPGPSNSSFLSSLIGNGLSSLSSGTWGPNMSGADIASNLIGLGKGLVESFMNNNETTDTPFNRPSIVNGEKVDATYYGPNQNYDYRTNYIALPRSKPYPGLNITLQDLCGVEDSEKIVSVDDFRKLLKQCEYITSSNKITGEYGGRNILTLDSDIHWEVVLEPYLGDDENGAAPNGGFSYLPSIKEINVINRTDFGHDTAYNKWIPISSFELQKSKLTTKSLGLFDGEIIYPITTEFTNEVRISIIDDQYKSWRHYFQKCSDVSVYNAEQHKADFYQLENPLPSVVDKTTFAAAYYKNITFRIKIFIMTPQYFTIRKMDLLCVLKDFSEDYHGESDVAGADLSVTFSVVGELGGPSYAEQVKKKQEEIKEKAKQEEKDRERRAREDEERKKKEEERKKEEAEKNKQKKTTAKKTAQAKSSVSGGKTEEQDKMETWYEYQSSGKDFNGVPLVQNANDYSNVGVYTEKGTGKKYIYENGKKQYLTYVKSNSEKAQKNFTDFSTPKKQTQYKDVYTGEWKTINTGPTYGGGVSTPGAWVSSDGKHIYYSYAVHSGGIPTKTNRAGKGKGSIPK